MTHRFFITVFLLMVVTLSTFSQIFEYIGTDNGLSSRRVLSIEQCKQSYIWILTHKGIDRYNGKKCTNFQLFHNGKNLNFYPNLNTLHTDSKGNIWEIGKDGYAFKYDDMKDKFQLMFDLKEQYPETRNRPITCVYMDSNDNLWYFTEGNLYLYSVQNRSVHKLSLRPEIGTVTHITEGEHGTLYLASESRLHQVSLLNYKLHDVKEIRLSGIRFINFLYYHYPSKQIVINTLLDDLFIYNIDKHRLICAGSQIKDIGINNIIPDRNNPYHLLIATDGDGVYQLDIRTPRLSQFLKEDTERPNKMNGSIVKDIYMDTSGRIWTVIYPTGITVYTDKYPAYEWITHSPNNKNSIANNCVNQIMEDSEGDVWFATCNGISWYDSSKRQWNTLLNSENTEQSSQSESHIFTSLCETKAGLILAGGYMSGLYVINKKQHTANFLKQEKAIASGERPDKYIRSIYRDSDGNIWTGGFYRLKEYIPSSHRTEEYNIGYPITYITQRDSSTLWIGTIAGLFIFDKASNSITPMADNEEIGCVNMIFKSSDDSRIFLGTYGNGLFIIDNKTKKIIRHYNSGNSGLNSNNIYSIVRTRHGDLVMGTENGLTLFATEKEEFFNWTKEQGLMASYFNPTAAVHTRDGQLMFGSTEGVIRLPDSMQLPASFKTEMVFSNLSIMYRKVYPNEPGSPLIKPLDQTETIHLTSNQNTFSLNVSSINFDNPSNIVYSWKLDGFYDQWSPLSRYGQIRYTNLSPGKYTLYVRAILLDKQEVLQERQIQIIIAKPLWLTFWAFLVYILLTIIVIYLIMRYKMIRRERKASQEKINFFMQTAHDIRTPLTLIKAPLGEIMKDEQLSEKGMTNLNLAIQNTESLSELANNLINFQKEELYSSRITVSKHELNRYLKDYLLQFNAYAIQKGIEINYSSTFDLLNVWIDTNKIDSILRNLLSNALKYTNKGGKIYIEAAHSKNRWHLTIKDTGIGIAKEDQKKLFRFLFRGKNATNQLVTGSGVGLLLTYRLIKNHEGRVSYSSTENVGTTFHLSFPIRSEHYQYNDSEADGQSANSVVLQEMPQTFETTLPTPSQCKDNAPKILIVEDNNSLRAFLARSLSDSYQVLEAENGKEALTLAKELQPDLILSDVMMPIMNGEEMCRALKGDIETSHIPVILLTALGNKQDILRGLESKADMYIVKPFDLMVLKANIINLLENRALIREKLLRSEVRVQESAPEAVALPTNLDEEFIQTVTAMVKENLSNDLTVDTLCAGMCMSRTSFYNKIKGLTGIAPNEFIRNIRMREAATLLVSKQYTVAEVSDMMGFADPKYFTDAFKKFYGVPPSVYKKNESAG